MIFKYVNLIIFVAGTIQCIANDIFTDYFIKRSQISAVITDAKWLCRFIISPSGDVFCIAIEKDALSYFEVRGRLKPGNLGNDDIFKLNLYSNLDIEYSDVDGNAYTVNMIGEQKVIGGLLTHEKYKYILSFFDKYHVESKFKECNYKYKKLNDDPDILQFAKLLNKKKSKLSEKIAGSYRPILGINFHAEASNLVVDYVANDTPSWYAGIEVGDVITGAYIDYEKLNLLDLKTKIKEDFTVVNLLLTRKKKGSEDVRFVKTLHRSTVLESMLLVPPAR